MKGGGSSPDRNRKPADDRLDQAEIRRAETERLLATLAEGVVNGDRNAGEQLAETVMELPYVRSAIGKVLFNESDVEEALQETTLAVVRSIGRFRGQSRYSTWITSIARNKAIDLLQAKSRRAALSEELTVVGGPSLGPEAQTFSSLLVGRLDLDSLLDELPDRLADVVRLRDIEQLSYEEIAERLDIKLNTVRSRLARGRARLGPAIAQQAGT